MPSVRPAVLAAATAAVGLTIGVAGPASASRLSYISVSWQAPQSGATLSGVIPGAGCEVAVTTHRTNVASVAFAIDGAALNTTTVSPYECSNSGSATPSLDTTQYPDGTHTLSVLATATNGHTASASVTVTFANTTSSPAPSPSPTSSTSSSPSPSPTSSSSSSPSPSPTSSTGSGSWTPPTSPPSQQGCAGPTTITQGGTYSGCWVSNGKGTVLTIATSAPVTITNSTLEGTSKLIESSVNHTHLTVTHSSLYGLYPGGSGVWGDYAVWMDGFDCFDFEHNYIDQKGGVKLNNWSGSCSSGSPVLVRYNYARNIDGRTTDGSGGYSGHVITQFLQFDTVQNAPGIEIAWNEIHNYADQSSVEDNISIFNSSGTSSSPINIHDNYIDGAFPFPATASSYSGGGIMLGDYAGDYEIAHDNQVVATTNYALAISAGQNESIYNNDAVASGLLPDGTKIPSMNVGVYIWNQYSNPFGNAQAYNNTVGWWQSTGSSRNDWWLPDCSGNCSNNHLNNNSSVVTLQDEADQANLWQTKLSNAGVTTGP